MKAENVIAEKSKTFGIRIIRLYQHLDVRFKGFPLFKQLLRSGTSIGANVRVSVYAQSTKDFISKLKIALKETNETEFWLELLVETEIKSFINSTGLGFLNALEPKMSFI